MSEAKTLRQKNKRDLYPLWTFLTALLTAALMFVPSLIKGEGYFIFYGDFNVQQIPFYQYCHDAVRNLDFGWSWESDLGSNFIGSYSFYLLGSPFFWLTLPFPNHIVPYLMGPLLILKFATAALTANLFIRRFTARGSTAMIGGLLYAFCGFSVYNVFFNHFHEAIVFFPLLLLSIEVFHAEKKRGLVILAVFACALTNYFFFFGMVVFAAIYWVIRVMSGSFKFKVTEFLLFALECVLGLLLAAAILVPTIMAVTQNERLSSIITGWNAVLYGKEQIFLNVIECFFFPPDLPARPVFFPGAEVKWSSLGGWLPLFSMVGTFCFLQSEKKGNWLRRVLFVMIFMALVPGLNAAFYMFNTAYYARWFYMPILLMCLATAIALEDTEVNWDTAWRWNMTVTLGFVLVIGLLPNGIVNGNIEGFGLYTDAKTNPLKFVYDVFYHLVDKTHEIAGGTYDLRFWLTCGFSVLSLLIVKAMLPTIKEKRKSLFKVAVPCICAISVLYGSFFLISGQSHSYDIKNVMIDNLIEGKVDLPIDNDEFARIDVLDGVDNTGYYLGYSSINYFHSIVPGSVVDFYEFIGEERSVASRPSTDTFGARSLLSVKYLLDPIIENSKDFESDGGSMKMPCYTYFGEQNGYKIYKNECYIPMGFTYDYFLTTKQASGYGDRIDRMMLKAMVVEDKDILKVSSVIPNISVDYNVGENATGKNIVTFTEESYIRDCQARAETAAYAFYYNSNSFTADVNLQKSNYVFFSVPFESGWTAFVNGQPAEILKVNAGFMAVLAPEGSSRIVFEYETPGLKLGLLVTVIAALLSVVYVAVILIKRVYRPITDIEYPEGEEITRRIAALKEAEETLERLENDDLLAEIDHDKIDAYQGFKGGFKVDDSVFEELKVFRLENSGTTEISGSENDSDGE
ncbi:MAG: hypothetical protein E7525_02235 [Ruminococcaceae bacterium]|nr:hypothetical protein [Oscillospiraceae bacterium]